MTNRSIRLIISRVRKPIKKAERKYVIKILERTEVIAATGCWIVGDCNILHYHKGEYGLTHRFMHEKFNGKLNNFACHHCDLPGCINPEHLFDGTNKENLNDYWDKYSFRRARGKVRYLCRWELLVMKT